MTPYEKIRAALEFAKECELGLHIKCNEALAALAELERAAREPVAIVLGIVVEWTGDQPTAGTKLYATPPAPVADARTAELERNIERLDAQWRDELRIYREVDGARIAELERDAARYRYLARLMRGEPELMGDAYGFRWALPDGILSDRTTLAAAIDEARAGNGGGV